MSTETLPTVSVKEGAHVVEAALNQLSSLGNSFTTIAEVLQLFADESTTAAELEAAISRDPILSAQLLKAVNSSFYGLPQKVGQIGQAIVLLGPKVAKNIVIANAVGTLLKGTSKNRLINTSDIWAHSIAVACAARQIAKQSKVVPPEDAFSAGVLHDIGLVVELRVYRTALIGIVERHREDGSVSLADMERKRLGASHEDFGAGLCRRWRFPESLVRAVGYHHRPLELPNDEQSLPLVIHAADIMAVQAEIGFVDTVHERELAPELLQQVGIDNSTAAGIVAGLRPIVDEALQSLG